MIEIFEKFLKEAPHQKALSSREAGEFYSLGFSLYGAGHFKEAADIFEVLSVAAPLESKHWFALASSRQENKEYEKALHAWAMAAILNNEDPYPHFHAAECCISLDLSEDAQIALDSAFKRSKDLVDLQDKITLLRQQRNLNR